MASEVASLHKMGEEGEKTRKKKLELDIEIAEIEKRAKLDDEKVHEAQRYVEMYKAYKELKEIHTDDEIAERFPYLKQFCKESK
jgi:Cdc6-like AAA superfamily ATPase